MAPKDFQILFIGAVLVGESLELVVSSVLSWEGSE